MIKKFMAEKCPKCGSESVGEVYDHIAKRWAVNCLSCGNWWYSKKRGRRKAEEAELMGEIAILKVEITFALGGEPSARGEYSLGS